MARTSYCSTFLFLLTTTSWFAPRLADDVVPFIMWAKSDCPDANSAVNPLARITTDEFYTVLNCRLGKSRPPVVVYKKDNFCSEHIRPYAKTLKEITPSENVLYVPAVQQPLQELRELPYYNFTSDEDTNVVTVGQILEKRISHLDAFYEHYKLLKKSIPDLVPILTGQSCTYRDSDRVKREATAENVVSTEFIIRTDRVLLYSSQPLYIKVGEDKPFVPVPQTPILNRTEGAGTQESPLILQLEFSGTNVSLAKYTLEFNFVIETAGYYTLTAVNYKPNDTSSNLLVSKSNIVFPFGFSYHCAQKILFHKDGVHLNITNLQVQINATSFGDVYDCVGFMSIPIWTGIFVTSILAVIMIWALTMIIDIRTMDRFDDPKGKTITIFAQE